LFEKRELTFHKCYVHVINSSDFIRDGLTTYFKAESAKKWIQDILKDNEYNTIYKGDNFKVVDYIKI